MYSPTLFPFSKWHNSPMQTLSLTLIHLFLKFSILHPINDPAILGCSFSLNQLLHLHMYPCQIFQKFFHCSYHPTLILRMSLPGSSFLQLALDSSAIFLFHISESYVIAGKIMLFHRLSFTSVNTFLTFITCKCPCLSQPPHLFFLPVLHAWIKLSLGTKILLLPCIFYSPSAGTLIL